MSTSPDIAAEATDMVVKGELHTKCVTARRLSKELRGLLGNGAQFKVEMRHNVYNIESTKPFDLEKLLMNCQRLSRTKSRFQGLGLEVVQEKAAPATEWT